VEIQNPGGSPTLDQVFSKGTPLPTERTIKYRATHALTPENPNSDVVIKLWEGEFLGDPDANEWVGNVVLAHDGVRRSVPEGAEIEVTIRIDPSRLISVEAFVPHLNQHFSGRLYVPQREEQDFSNLSHGVASEARTYRQRLAEMERSLPPADDVATKSEVEGLRREIDALEAKAPASDSTSSEADPDSARRIVETSKSIRGRLGRLERGVAGQRSSAENTEFVQLVEAAGTVVEQFGSTLEKQQFAMLHRELERAGAKNDDNAIKRACAEIDGLRWRVLGKHDWFWREILESLAQPNVPFVDHAQAQQLMARGQAAVSSGDGKELREVVRALWDLQPKGISEVIRERAMRSGLRKY
jgi:molecular chaperone DnaK